VVVVGYRGWVWCDSLEEEEEEVVGYVLAREKLEQEIC
jgi:hypothetical protein